MTAFLLLSITGLAQTASAKCPSSQTFSIAPCANTTLSTLRFGNTQAPNQLTTLSSEALAAGSAPTDPRGLSPQTRFISTASTPVHEHFHWGRAFLESFMFLSIEQAYVVKDDYRWVVVENGVPLNHYWRDYKQSLTTWTHAGWDDGDPALYSYVGHPIQGALTGYIQIQNDPQGRNLEFANSKDYWWSRFKGFLWNAAYSTQWNIGPLSELTVEKYGAQARPPWNKDGSWPCTRRPCVSGVGQVDLVMTPVGGFAWILTEDLLDKEVAKRLEAVTQNHFLIDVTRCALNPIRGGANILHGRAPWHRPSRDARQVYFSYHQSRMRPAGTEEPRK